MTRRRKTDGERIADRLFGLALDNQEQKWLAMQIDHILRKRMAEAWEDGWLDQYNDRRRLNENPYRGGRRKK